MRFKKKSFEITTFPLLSENFLISMKDEDRKELCNSYLMKLNSCVDAVQQISTLKEVHKLMMSKEEEENYPCYLNILSYVFYRTPVKSSLKKALNRIFLDIYEQMPSAVTSSLEDNLNYSMESLNGEVSFTQIEEITDCLLGLLDNNFKLGPQIVNKELMSVWRYLSEVVVFLQDSFDQISIEENNICQVILKTIIYIFQKCEKAEQLSSNCSGQQIKRYLVCLLDDGETYLNCRLNAGIAYSYFVLNDPKMIEAKSISRCELALSQLEHFSQPSQLCILSGIMAVVSLDEFMEDTKNGAPSETILNKIIFISNCMEDADLLLLCTRDLIQWTNVMSNVLRKEDVQEDANHKLKKMFIENGIYVTILFKYVLDYREHYIDTLRHLTKDLFINLLKLHLQSIDIEPCESGLLKSWTLFLLCDLPIYNNGKYGLLSCIVNTVGTEVISRWCSTLPEVLYQASSETSLISHVSELLESLYRKFLGSEETFQAIWLRPLIHHLCFDSVELVSSTNDHILPKLFKARPSSIHFLINELAGVWEKNKGHCFSALITCIKLHQKEKMHKSVLECIKKDSLLKAFCHADDQVRLSAFGLLCENQKTTEAVMPEYLDLIKYSLPYNINCQTPSFRQQMVASLKKLFSRMKESSYYMEKSVAAKGDGISEYLVVLKAYKSFVDWLIDFLYESLHPGANFPRRVSALNILLLVYSIFPESLLDHQISAFLTLLYALQDTYENNKQVALKILCSSSLSNFMQGDNAFLSKSLNAALILASSTKPPDTVTAAYLLSLLVQSKCFTPVVLRHVSQQMEEGLLPFTDLPSIESDGSALLLTVLLLSGELLKQFRIAQESLLDAAAHAPMYGALSCLKSILSQVNYSEACNSKSSSLWNSVLCEIVQLCMQIADVVEPVVCDSSPEGYLPMDINSESIRQLQSTVRKALSSRFSSAVVQGNHFSEEPSTVKLDVVKTHAVTAQILLLCCWRTHKEISLLFGEMCERIPIKKENNGILGVDEVAAIGNYFIRQMTLVKHRGAFEQAYVGFGKLCSTLWRCNVASLKEMPKMWLKDLLSAIQGQNETIQLCPTRRSAGLPFIIQAILTTELNLPHSTFFKETVLTFLNLAIVRNENETNYGEIHSLNILRALFRDACLSEVLVPFVSEALKISITGFKSKSWAIRNASTLLFSTLLVRIFGVNRANDEAQKKNRLSGKTFFSYYQNTYLILKNELENCTSVLSKNPNCVSEVPTLYPVLLVLGKLYPAPGEADHRLNSFIPFLKVCGSSPVWKIRVLVAKAVVSLMSVENTLPTLQSLFDSLPTCHTLSYQQNKVHGILLQVLYILRESTHSPGSLKSSLAQTLPTLISQYFHLALSTNRCFSTRAAFLEIVLHSMAMGVSLGINEGKLIKKNLLADLKSSLVGPDKDRYLSVATVVTVFQSLLSEGSEEHENLVLTHSKCDLLLEFLTSSHDSVKCAAIQLLIWFAEHPSSTPDAENQIEPVFLEGSTYSSVRLLMQKHKVPSQNLLKNDQLLLCIIHMFNMESKCSSCFGKLCQLLCSMHQVVELKWPFVQTIHSCDIFNKLEYSLAIFEECTRDDVADSLISLIGKMGLYICKQLLKDNESGCTTMMENKEYASALERLFQTLKRNVEPEYSTPRRKLVAKILQDLCYESLFNHSKIFGYHALHLWETLLAILIDDEPEVKAIAANIVVKIQAIFNNDNQKLPIVSTKALEEMMRIFLKLEIFPMPDYIGIFINWMLLFEKDSFENMGDEHPFDRGELNVFAEELLLSHFACEQLSQHMTWHSGLLKEDCTVSAGRITCWAQIENKEKYDIDSTITKCLSQIDAILENIHHRGALFFLLDASLGQDVIRICQHLYAIVSLVPWAKSRETLICRISDISIKIKNFKMNIYILDMLLANVNSRLLENSES